MTSFLSIESYSPILVLFFGILTYLGFAGTGLAILRLFKIALPSPWSRVAGILIGIQVGSLLVQVVAMTGFAFTWVLISIWLFMVVMGIMILISDGLVRKKISFSLPHRLTYIVAIPVLLAILANLIAALAPSTKIDELYYHMLLPSRIVTDHALVFYRYPLECAVLPQMIYQFSLTPLHALGFPDAGNVVSLGLNLTLIGLGWTLIRNSGGIQPWAWIWIATLCIGMYPVIWQVTGGAFAMGDLATAAAVLVLFLRSDLLKKMPVRHYYLLFSIFLMGSVSSKVSLAPVALFMMLINGFLLFSNVSLKSERLKIICLMLIPWLIFYLPVLLWTWSASGTPFGPFSAGMFGGESVYSSEVIRAQMQQNREMNMPTVLSALKSSIIDYTPLLWVGVLMIFLEKTIFSVQKLIIFLILLFQLIVIVGFLFFDLRFFGGLIQGLALFFAVMTPATSQRKLMNHPYKIIALTLFFLIPWLTIQIYYTAQFAGVVTGWQPKADFYRSKTSFFEDYRIIDQLLPDDAVILFSGPLRLNSAYAPRAVYFVEADIPPGRPVFLMIADRTKVPGDPFGRYRVGEMLYENNHAIAEIYRTPGIPNRIRQLRLFSLQMNNTP
jgi:hypothetical protein